MIQKVVARSDRSKHLAHRPGSRLPIRSAGRRSANDFVFLVCSHCADVRNSLLTVGN